MKERVRCGPSFVAAGTSIIIMCGIVAVLCEEGTLAVPYLYEGLLALQHRGQDAAGIVTEDRGRLALRKDNGMVRDVFGSSEHVAKLTGSVGIGHVRYPTAGSSCSAEAQPFYVNSPFGIVLAHNGNLVNCTELKAEMVSEWRHLNTGSDSEVLLNIFAAAVRDSVSLRSSSPKVAGALPGCNDADVLAAVRNVMRRCIGGYAVVTLIVGWGLVAFRDPHGIRPLVYGRRKNESGAVEYMAASESGALSSLGFALIGDVPPGHALILTRKAEPQLHDCIPAGKVKPIMAPCVFEYVYFARPDSVLDGVSVYRARLRMGAKLANRILATWKDHDIDVVIPVPDTSRTAALECAGVLGIKYREGFLKNRYIGRTFIMPQQGLRKKSVRQKLSPIASEFLGRNVLLVDDSIVRGTTCGEIVLMAREAGAKRVYIASAAPPVSGSPLSPPYPPVIPPLLPVTPLPSSCHLPSGSPLVAFSFPLPLSPSHLPRLVDTLPRRRCAIPTSMGSTCPPKRSWSRTKPRRTVSKGSRGWSPRLWVPIASCTRICTISRRPSKRRPRCARSRMRASCGVPISYLSRTDLVCRPCVDLARFMSPPSPPPSLVCRTLRRKRASTSPPSSPRASTVPT